MNTNYVAYLRVSTAKQGRSGLGVEAQREAVQRFVSGRGVIIAPEFVEVETGKRNDRPELAKALRHCKLTGATLVVAKLDRLSRNAAFLMTLRDAGTPFIAADMPEANTMTIGIMAVMAQHEREMISQRTKAALKASKKKLGGLRAKAPDISQWQGDAVKAVKAKATTTAEQFREIMQELQHLSLNETARELNKRGIKAVRGGEWTPTGVQRVLSRL